MILSGRGMSGAYDSPSTGSRRPASPTCPSRASTSPTSAASSTTASSPSTRTATVPEPSLTVASRIAVHSSLVRVPSSDGVTVAVHDLGGSGEPLLISPATGFCGGAYGPLATELHERFHVYALDYRAHGESSAPGSEALAWERMTDDLEAAT